METLQFTCESCGSPNLRIEYRPRVKNHQFYMQEQYHCKDCGHVELIDPEEISDQAPLMLFMQ
jgi:hypothetical protein